MDFRFVEDTQRKKNLVPTFATYYGAVAAMVSMKECLVTVEMLANVSLTPDEKDNPDYTVSTLAGECCMKLALGRVMLQRACGTTVETPLLRTGS